MEKTRAEIKLRLLNGHREVATRMIEAAQRAMQASEACGIDPASAIDQLQKARAYMVRVEEAMYKETKKNS